MSGRTLVINDDKSIGILYEEGSSRHDGIYYIEANLEKVTSAKDAYIPTLVKQQYPDGVSPNTNPIGTPHQLELDPQTGDLTITVNFSLSATANTQTHQFLARKGNRHSTEEGWGLFIEGGKIKFRANEQGNKYGVEADLPANLATDKHTITSKFDRTPEGGDEIMSIYFNGVKLTSTPLYDTLNSGTAIATTSPLSVAGSDGISPLNGLVFGYHVYGYGLDSTTIKNYAKSHLKDYDFSAFFDNPENNNFEDFFNN